MKSDLMGLLLLLSLGMAEAAPLERPLQETAVLTAEAAPVRNIRPQTSPARKAEITRRMFWLALCMR